jgi:hypothetical protein
MTGTRALRFHVPAHRGGILTRVAPQRAGMPFRTEGGVEIFQKKRDARRVPESVRHWSGGERADPRGAARIMGLRCCGLLTNEPSVDGAKPLAIASAEARDGGA